MASVFTHAFVAVTAGTLQGPDDPPARFWILAVVCAILPDVDSIGFFLGVPYDHPFGHRGFTHSLFFALIVALLASTLFFSEGRVFSRRWLRMTLVFFVITASHGALDALTDGGRGIAFLAPWLPLRDPAAQPDGLVLRDRAPLTRVETLRLADGALRYVDESRRLDDGAVEYRRGKHWKRYEAGELAPTDQHGHA